MERNNDIKILKNNIEQEKAFDILNFVTKEKIEKGIEEISSVGRSDKGRECYAFTKEEDMAFDVVKKKAEALALVAEKKDMHINIEEDAIGNLYVRLEGEKLDEPAVAFGSHIDSVEFGGSYDGVAGVEAGYRAIEAVVESGQKLERSVELIAFRAEESSPRSGYACLGSAVATGQITKNDLDDIVDKLSGDNGRMIDVFEEKGLDLSEIYKLIENPKITANNYSSFIELHIEQGSVLNSKNFDIGVVTGSIGGNERFDMSVKLKEDEIKDIKISENYNINKNFSFDISGQADHTGGTPMNKKEVLKEDYDTNLRRDAMVTASALVMVCTKLKKEFRDKDVKFSIISLIDSSNSSYTKIPSSAKLEVLVQGNNDVQVDNAKSRINEYVKTIFDNRKTPITITDQVLDTKKLNELKPIDDRFIEFSKIIYDIQAIARRVSSQKEFSLVRATVGDFKLDSSGLSFKLDIREANHELGKKLKEEIMCSINNLTGDKLKLEQKILSSQSSAPIDLGVEKTLNDKAKEIGFSVGKLPSVPGQDAKNISKSGVPTGMIYVKSEAGGVSHNKNEYTSPDIIKNGTRLLLLTVLELSRI